MTVSDTSRAIQHDPDHTWPRSVTITVSWEIDGHLYRTQMPISGDQFFGRGAYGAPIEGAALIGMIERIRRAGPPLKVFKAVKKVPARKAKKHGKKR